MRYTVQVPMRWSDMDAYGHVNNVVHLQYFEMARVALFFERASLEERTGLRRGTVVAAHEIRYKLPVVYSARPLDVQLWVSGVRAASFTCHYEVFDHDRLAVTGSTLLVPFDFTINRPRRLSADEKEFLERWADEPGE
ncbi:acyl-CoA thioester hydrolase [Geodermatophilus saharensis]|uniref:Acyl-CoA thioester hydrolase n=1 Tax=Geodermatophilus saharensis TaxID=1137994 RepID=A0A239IU93_9ACTN|nr:thioesterase family protein [Geodermatophilus saharensis]SNS97139.1 acyl-CoA thioester hydrolase [Geodermatophilus saharensis]